ncbi:hypothetical protein [Mucilaginibacter sp.]|uniref:hypothetical protein n=1 Tax=Mucilaginibacter sp. TaxID=1882438 RepID=UPI0026298634|nr:hypothetical protein [Mucilaginibacter sp.]
MKKLKVELFENELFGKISFEEKLVIFVNENNIQKDDILKIVYKSNNPRYALFYYAEE